MNVTASPAYELHFDQATGQLYGYIANCHADKSPSDKAHSEKTGESIRKTPSGLHFQKSLRDGGFEHFYLEPSQVAIFLRSVGNQTPGRYLLGERRDASVDIEVSPDELTAWLKITPAKGGTPLSIESVKQKMAEKAIDAKCLLPDILDKIQKHLNEEFNLLFAKGKHPEAGKSAQFERLLESWVELDLDAAAEGAIDLHNNFKFVNVEPGQKLLRKIPASQGEPGRNIFGKAIPSMPGEDLEFAQPFEGVALAENDENLLVATRKGHPIFSSKGVKVDLVLSLPAVDIHSGNVDYDGSIFIAGDIESGFDVRASGDIVVKGRVAKSNIHAGGSITIHGGVLGDETSNSSTRLHCEGKFHARFVNSACIYSEADVHVDEYLMHSRVSAVKGIYLGQEKGKGRIIGGYVSSDLEIVAKSLGSEAAVSTLLVLGAQEGKNVKLEGKVALLHRRHSEHQQLKMILNKSSEAVSEKLGRVNLDKLTKIRNTVVALESQIEKLEFEVEELKGQRRTPEVRVSGTIFPGVKVNIFGQAWLCETETRRKLVKLIGSRVQTQEPEN